MKRRFLHGLNLVIAKGTDDFCRVAKDKRVARNLLALCEQRAGAEDDVVTNLRITEDNGAHSDQAVAADMRTVQNGIVPDKDIITDVGRRIHHNMNRAVILYIRVLADANRLEITAHDRIKPKAATFSNLDIANDSCIRRDEDILVNLWLLTVIWHNRRHSNHLYSISSSLSVL